MIFDNAFNLCGVDISCRDFMFPLLQTMFFRGPALVYLMEVVINDAKRREETMEMPEDHFSDGLTRPGSDEVWLERSFELVETMRASQNQQMSHRVVLNDLMTDISKLAGIRTRCGHSADVTGKTIAAVRGIELFSLLSRNPRKQLQALNSALRSRALEGDRAALKFY